MSHDSLAIDQPDGAASARRNLAEQLRVQGLITKDAIAFAIEAVPWHLFFQPASTADLVRTVAREVRLLESLDLHTGHRVLEIGTRSGYATALLCAILQPLRVTSIDVHPDRIVAVRDRLRRCGFEPTLLVGDGSGPMPHNTPHVDRVLARCGVARIPAAWLRCTRPGGVVVTPIGAGAVLARLTVLDDHGASGPLLAGPIGGCGWLRHYAVDTWPTDQEVLARIRAQQGTTGRTWLSDAVVDPRVRWLVELALPDIRPIFVPGHQGSRRPSCAYVDTTSDSWAVVTPIGAGAATITTYGNRPIWAGLVRLFGQAADADDFYAAGHGLAVTASGDHLLWRGSPDHPVRRLSEKWTRARVGVAGRGHGPGTGAVDRVIDGEPNRY